MAMRHGPRLISSCDSCRALRIGCDLRTKSHSGDPCSNCKRRGRECLVKQVKAISKQPSTESAVSRNNSQVADSFNNAEYESSIAYLASLAHTTNGGSRQPGHETHPHHLDASTVFFTEDHLAREQLALTLHHILWDIFTGLFETQIGILIGSECCPFKHTLTAPTRLISRLMITLDTTKQTETNIRLMRSLGLTSMPSDGNSNSLNQALLSAVHAYSARWLSADNTKPCSSSTRNSWKIKEGLLRDLWEQAYSKVQLAMAIPSYTSILALHLFGNTPTSPHSEERRVNELCSGIVLQHYNTMSVRAGKLSHESKPAKATSITPKSTQKPELAGMEYAQMEDTAYWFGIICDTYRSLTGCKPSVLLSSITEENKVWTSVRQEISDFQHRARTQRWLESRLPLSIESIYSIVGNGSACRALAWRAISRVQDALFHKTTGISVEEATHNALQELDLFHAAFGSLVGICRRDFALSNEKIRISCFLLDLEFGLGVLILVDTLSATSYSHLLPSEYELRISSARAIVNAVNMILQTDHYTFGNHASNSNLLQVPYPEHIINGLSRAGSSLIHLYKTKSVSASMVEIMFCVIFTGLETLQIVSFSAKEAFDNLLSLSNECGLRPKSYQDSSESMAHSNKTSPAVELALYDREFLESFDKNINDNPDIINSTIQRHEIALDAL